LPIDRLPAALAPIHGAAWRDPGPDALRDILGRQWNLPDLELFDFPRMQAVAGALDAGYVDLPQFCMTRGPASDSDPRLSLASALIIAGSKVPGDDVFVAADFRRGDEVSVRVFDWDSEMPNRWRHVSSFTEFATEIARRASARDS
jgi:hypothetical protein